MLSLLEVEHDMEKTTDDGYFSLDIVVNSPAGRLAVEADGPSHFNVNTGQYSGSSSLRYGPFWLQSSPFYGAVKVLTV